MRIHINFPSIPVTLHRFLHPDHAGSSWIADIFLCSVPEENPQRSELFVEFEDPYLQVQTVECKTLHNKKIAELTMETY